MKLLAMLLYTSVLGAATTTALPPPKPVVPKTTTVSPVLTPIQQVQKYADGRKITTRKWGGNYWVEVENVDAHGVGKTLPEAIQDFLYRVDLLDHETNKPHLTTIPQDSGKPAPFVCPQDQDCT